MQCGYICKPNWTSSLQKPYFASKKYSWVSHQAKRPEDREARHVCQPKLDEWKSHNNEVKYIPALLEVEFGAHGHQLDAGFDGERRSEELKYSSDIVLTEFYEADYQILFYSLLLTPGI